MGGLKEDGGARGNKHPHTENITGISKGKERLNFNNHWKGKFMALKEVNDIVEKAKKAKEASKSKAVSLAVSNAKEQVSKDVQQLSEHKWQITGNTVAEIKAASENMDAAKKRAIQIVQEAHRALWDLINKKTGTSKEESLRIDVEHIKEGIIFLIRDPNKGKSRGTKIGSLADLMRHVMEDGDE